MPIKNQKGTDFFARQYSSGQPGNGIAHENTSFDGFLRSGAHSRTPAWGNVKRKDATYRVLQTKRLNVSMSLVMAARQVMASAFFAGELGLEWVYWHESESLKLSDAVHGCWKFVLEKEADEAPDTHPLIDQRIARNLKDYPAEKRSQFRSFCSDVVRRHIQIHGSSRNEDPYIFCKKLTDDFKILCKPASNNGVEPKEGHGMFLSNIIVSCLRFFWTQRSNQYHKFDLITKAGWFNPFNEHTIVLACGNIMLAAKQYRDQRQVNSAEAISLFQQVKDIWLSMCPQNRHHICMSFTEKVRMSSPAVEVLEIPRSDYWNTWEDIEDDSDYQEMIKRDTCTLKKADEESKPFRSYQGFMSPEPKPCSNSQVSPLDPLGDSDPHPISRATNSRSPSLALEKLGDIHSDISKPAPKRTRELAAVEGASCRVSKKSRMSIGTTKRPPISVTRIFDTDDKGTAVHKPVHVQILRNTRFSGWCKALEGTAEFVYKWALEKDWEFLLPAHQAAKGSKVKTIQCQADVKAMLKQVEGGSIVVYAIAYSESTDEEDEACSSEKSSNLKRDEGDRKTREGIQENKWLRLID